MFVFGDRRYRLRLGSTFELQGVLEEKEAPEVRFRRKQL
jgi:hypothetical protein